MGRKHSINFYHDSSTPKPEKPNLALPGVLHVNNGDLVTFHATNSDVLIFIPNANKLIKNAGKNIQISIRAGGSSKGFRIDIGSNKTPLTFPYAVFCERGNDFAEGNSSPKIIVD